MFKRIVRHREGWPSGFLGAAHETKFGRVTVGIKATDGCCESDGVGLRVEYPIWLEHKCSGIYNFYPLTHQGSHAFHNNRRKGKRNLPLVDRFVKPSKSAPWFIRIFKGAAFLKI